MITPIPKSCATYVNACWDRKLYNELCRENIGGYVAKWTDLNKIVYYFAALFFAEVASNSLIGKGKSSEAMAIIQEDKDKLHQFVCWAMEGNIYYVSYGFSPFLRPVLSALSLSVFKTASWYNAISNCAAYYTGNVKHSPVKLDEKVKKVGKLAFLYARQITLISQLIFFTLMGQVAKSTGQTSLRKSCRAKSSANAVDMFRNQSNMLFTAVSLLSPRLSTPYCRILAHLV